MITLLLQFNFLKRGIPVSKTTKSIFQPSRQLSKIRWDSCSVFSVERNSSRLNNWLGCLPYYWYTCFTGNNTRGSVEAYPPLTALNHGEDCLFLKTRTTQGGNYLFKMEVILDVLKPTDQRACLESITNALLVLKDTRWMISQLTIGGDNKLTVNLLNLISGDLWNFGFHRKFANAKALATLRKVDMRIKSS